MNTTTPSLEAGSNPPAPWRERVWFVLVALVLVGLGGGFWLTNGTRTFGELMLGAFSWCF
jgi:hypothetical protein